MGHPGGLGGLVPPCTHHPKGCSMGWAWNFQGIPSQSRGMLEQSIPHPCQPWAPRWSSRWEPQSWFCQQEISKGRKVTKKSLNLQIFTARTGFLWELGKGEHKQGQGCPQSIPGILQSPRALTAPRSHLHCPS